MALEREYAFFAENKDSLLEHHEGKFALIYGDSLIGVWDSKENAYNEGIEQLGNVAFLIKHIVAEDAVESIPALFVGAI